MLIERGWFHFKALFTQGKYMYALYKAVPCWHMDAHVFHATLCQQSHRRPPGRSGCTDKAAGSQ